MHTRRTFLRNAAAAAAALHSTSIFAQEKGARPVRADGVSVLNPRTRVPVGIIVDDSTCLVNLNRFAMPQFQQGWGGGDKPHHQNWRDWPHEIPDSFVRKFGEWAVANGVKGKYSIVPFPACVGRLDRTVPGWTQREIADSIELVRTLMMPNWDIHPEMVTHTRVIDIKTGHPFPDFNERFMENIAWTTGRSADEIAAYMAYALDILKNVGLPCEGVTTPGGFGNKARPQLAQATFDACRSVFKAEIPHYFRDLFSEGNASVAPRVELAADLDTDDPRCVVHVLGCTGDWTGGWDNCEPDGADKFITADGARGRMVDVITRGEPAIMVCHWTGIWWNGRELGFEIFKEVVRRLHARFDNLLWMKNSEVARYWAARELTTITRDGANLKLRAPFACPEFTVKWPAPAGVPRLRVEGKETPLAEVASPLKLTPGTWHREKEHVTACFALPKGASEIVTG